jgi:exodeoxyribonuclease VII small subunit
MSDLPEDALRFETALEQLQMAVKNLESGELTLEQSLKQFERGVQLTRLCQAHLKVADQKVDVLLKQTSQEGVESFQLEPLVKT